MVYRRTAWYFRAGFLNASARIFAQKQIKDHNDTAVGDVKCLFGQRDDKQLGDVEKVFRVKSDLFTQKTGKEMRMRLPLASDAYSGIEAKLDETRKLLEEWKDVIVSTDLHEKLY